VETHPWRQGQRAAGQRRIGPDAASRGAQLFMLARTVSGSFSRAQRFAPTMMPTSASTDKRCERKPSFSRGCRSPVCRSETRSLSQPEIAKECFRSQLLERVIPTISHFAEQPSPSLEKFFVSFSGSSNTVRRAGGVSSRSAGRIRAAVS
jgi:hypothetical protein